jgi:hypothetical protein
MIVASEIAAWRLFGNASPTATREKRYTDLKRDFINTK